MFIMHKWNAFAVMLSSHDGKNVGCIFFRVELEHRKSETTWVLKCKKDDCFVYNTLNTRVTFTHTIKNDPQTQFCRNICFHNLRIVHRISKYLKSYKQYNYLSQLAKFLWDYTLSFKPFILMMWCQTFWKLLRFISHNPILNVIEIKI